MTPQQIEALKLALEALQFALQIGFDESSESQIKKGDKAGQQHRKAITAIKEALAEHAMQEVQRLGQEIEQGADSFCDSHCSWTDHHPDCKLAQPEQEPVAWISTSPARMIHWTSDKPAYGDDWIPLYTKEQL